MKSLADALIAMLLQKLMPFFFLFLLMLVFLSCTILTCGLLFFTFMNAKTEYAGHAEYAALELCVCNMDSVLRSKKEYLLGRVHLKIERELSIFIFKCRATFAEL